MGKLPVHDHNMPLGMKVFSGLLQCGRRFRNHCIRKTEQHPVNWHRQKHPCCVLLPQLDVVPLMALGKLPGFCQHRVAAVDAKDFSRRTDGIDKQTKISACPTTDLKHLITRLKAQSRYRFGPNIYGKPEQDVKQRVDRRQMTIAPTNKIDFVIETQALSPQSLNLPARVWEAGGHARIYPFTDVSGIRVERDENYISM